MGNSKFNSKRDGGNPSKILKSAVDLTECGSVIKKGNGQDFLNFDIFCGILGERIHSLKKLGDKITEIENGFIGLDVSSLALGQQMGIYKILTDVQIETIETLRKVLNQIDLDDVMRVFGLVSLSKKIQNITPEAMKRISNALTSLKDN